MTEPNPTGETCPHSAFRTPHSALRNLLAGSAFSVQDDGSDANTSGGAGRGKHRVLLCCALLALTTVAVYLPVILSSFVIFDDTAYLTDNPHVQAGLTWESVRWAFLRAHAANWHPVTWLSHLLDCELYGLKPAGHHLTGMLIHTANTVLLFGLLKRLTGAFWRSAFVAALFALHPLHVESVAWVAERKDVLSTLFFLLTLWAYARYAERECRMQNAECRNGVPASRFTFHASHYYLLSLFFFALGLMSKPMLVTLPFVLLLLDYWPLKRVRSAERGMRSSSQQSSPPLGASLLALLLEKVPFFVLSVACCVVTLIVQRQGGAMAPLEGGLGVPVEARIVNMPIGYLWYLAKLLWPTDLAVIYPQVNVWPLGRVLLATALWLALTGAAFWQGRRRAYLSMGGCGTWGRWCR